MAGSATSSTAATGAATSSTSDMRRAVSWGAVAEGAKAEAPAMAAERMASFMFRYVLVFVKSIRDNNYELSCCYKEHTAHLRLTCSS
mmetsp:Transcript_4698/g.9836  ORF Transcript_4698/g.9836 Transcript_4698/m.9836 type:complete len:87 (-) Transcript_4698:63-323(-)